MFGFGKRDEKKEDYEATSFNAAQREAGKDKMGA